MAKGTFRQIVAKLNVSMSDVRSAFGRTAAEIARQYLNEVLDRLPANARAAITKIGDLWRAVVGPAYKGVAYVIRDKLAQNTLTLQGGKFNVTKEEVDRVIDRNTLNARVNRVLSEVYKVPATVTI